MPSPEGTARKRELNKLSRDECVGVRFTSASGKSLAAVRENTTRLCAICQQQYNACELLARELDGKHTCSCTLTRLVRGSGVSQRFVK